VKVYYICEICLQVFDVSEMDGHEGSMEMRCMCEECSQEMGFAEPGLHSRQLFYN
jgi:hypothetical protein